MGKDGKLKMPDINNIERSGRTTNAADLAYLPDGRARISFQIACSVGHGDNGTTDFLSVKAWGKTAELAEGMRKGAPVIVYGKFVIETGKDGDKCYPTIWAFRIVQLDWDPDESQQDARQPAQRPAPRPPQQQPIEEPPQEDDVPF